MEGGNSQAILLARRPRIALGYGRVLARLCGRVRMMRAGKDNLAIPLIGWVK